MEYVVVLEEGETGVVIADVPQLPGCHTQGRTKEEAMRNIREAIELYLSVDPQPTTRFLGIEHISVEV